MYFSEAYHDIVVRFTRYVHKLNAHAYWDSIKARNRGQQLKTVMSTLWKQEIVPALEMSSENNSSRMETADKEAAVRLACKAFIASQQRYALLIYDQLFKLYTQEIDNEECSENYIECLRLAAKLHWNIWDTEVDNLSGDDLMYVPRLIEQYIELQPFVTMILDLPSAEKK